MEAEKIAIRSRDGLELVVHQWEIADPVGVLCLIPGFGEHSGRYQDMAAMLNQKGWSVFSLDNRGHGISAGKRGHTPSYELLMSDIEELLKHARASWTDLPMALFGHSMGGNLVANYMLRMNTNEIAGFVLSAPWFRMVTDPPAWRIKLGKLLMKIAPGLQQEGPLDTTLLSKLEAVQQGYADDPLVHGKITPRLFFGIYEAGEWAIRQVKKLKKPGLVYHGTDDGLIDINASREFALQEPEKLEWWEVVGARHEPHNDEEQAQVYEKLVDWLNQLT